MFSVLAKLRTDGERGVFTRDGTRCACIDLKYDDDDAPCESDSPSSSSSESLSESSGSCCSLRTGVDSERSISACIENESSTLTNESSDSASVTIPPLSSSSRLLLSCSESIGVSTSEAALSCPSPRTMCARSLAISFARPASV